MTDKKTILVIGTYDTKDPELTFVCDTIRGMGGAVLTMDVSVLGDPSEPTDISKHDVAAAAGKTIQDAIDAGDENRAMQIMARGRRVAHRAAPCRGPDRRDDRPRRHDGHRPRARLLLRRCRWVCRNTSCRRCPFRR